MVDPNRFLREWLLTPQRTISGVVTNNPVLSIFGTQNPTHPWPVAPIFAGHLPEKYDPRQTGNGMAIVVRVGGSGITEGGTAHPEIPIIDPRMEVMVWAGINEFELARSMDRALFDWVHAKAPFEILNVGFAINSLNVVLGQDVTDTKTGLATIVSFYHLQLRENLT